MQNANAANALRAVLALVLVVLGVTALVAQDLDVTHPLLRGIAAWYPTLPTLTSGVRWYPAKGLSVGTLLNGARFVPEGGRFGTVVAFDGVNDSVSMGTAPLLSTSAFSVCIWIRPAGTAEVSHIIEQASFAEGGWILQTGGAGLGSSTAADPLFMVLPPGGTPASYVRTNGSAPLVNAAWNFLCGVYDGAGATDADKLKVYVNTVLQSTLIFGTPVPSSIGATTAALVVANPQADTGNAFFTGSAANLFLYNRALSASDIQQLFTCGDPTYCDMVVHDDIVFTPAPAVVVTPGGWTLSPPEIVLAQPLSPAFPLATRLTAWYRVNPGLAGGKTWYASAGRTPGILTTMIAPPADGWGGTMRPGGDGEMRFSGTGYVLLGNPPALQVTTGACSLCVWVNITAPPPGAPNDSRAPGIVALTDNGTGITRALDLSVYPAGNAPDDGRASFEAYDGTNNPQVIGDTSLVGAGWQHLCAIRGNGQLRLFQNGREASTSPVTDTTTTINVAGLAWAIGSRLDSDFGWAMTGMVDDVMILNGYALTPSDVQMMYQDSRQGDLLALNRVSVEFPPAASVRRPSIGITNY